MVTNFVPFSNPGRGRVNTQESGGGTVLVQRRPPPSPSVSLPTLGVVEDDEVQPIAVTA
jgi:hypothetical protein